jgi:hypothetical protein
MSPVLAAIALAATFAAPAFANEEQTCFGAVQGKVAWDRAGNLTWQEPNLRAFCRGALDHTANIACFRDEIEKTDDWRAASAKCRGPNPPVPAAAEVPGLGMTVHKASQAPAEKRPRPGPPKREFLNDLVCSSRDVSISDNFDTNFVGKSEALRKVLVPGAIFHLDDLLNGGLATVGSDATRLPYRIYVSFNDRTSTLTGGDDAMFATGETSPGDSSLYRDVDGTFSGAQSALSSIVRGRSRNANYATSFEVHEVASDEQLNIAMNGAASYNGFDMETTFGFDKNSSKTKIVGQFMQRYYSVSVDYQKLFGTGPEAWFIEDVVDDLREAEKARGPLVYIDQVAYGRAAYFFTETAKSDLAVAATLKAAYSGAGGEASGDVATDYKSHFASDDLRVVSIGGGNEDAAIVDNIEDFRTMVTRQPPSSGLGDAIAYTVRFVDDNSVAMINVATTFKERDCTRLENRVAFGIDKIKVNVADDEGTDNRIEIVALGLVTATHDVYANGRWEERVQVASIDLNVALGDSGSVRENIDRYVTFTIPDDPETPDVNEVKTARFKVQWNIVYEDDSSSQHDVLSAYNANDGARTVTLAGLEKRNSRPYFRFRGSDQQSPDADVELHFSLRPAD